MSTHSPYAILQGSPDDYRFPRARKIYTCEHVGPHSRQIPFPCEHPEILPGAYYTRTRQEARISGSEAPVSVECLIKAGWVR